MMSFKDKIWQILVAVTVVVGCATQPTVQPDKVIRGQHRIIE